MTESSEFSKAMTQCKLRPWARISAKYKREEDAVAAFDSGFIVAVKINGNVLSTEQKMISEKGRSLKNLQVSGTDARYFFIIKTHKCTTHVITTF